MRHVLTFKRGGESVQADDIEILNMILGLQDPDRGTPRGGGDLSWQQSSDRNKERFQYTALVESYLNECSDDSTKAKECHHDYPNMMWGPSPAETCGRKTFALGDREATELAGKQEVLVKRLNQATPDGESSTRRKSRQLLVRRK